MPSTSSLSSVHSSSEIPRQLHPHKDPARKERNQDEHEPNTDHEHPIQLRREWVVRLVEQDEAETAQGEHETRREAFHDVLTVDTIRHECDRSRIPAFVSGGTDTRRLDNHVVDDATTDEEVREEDEPKDGHRRREANPLRFL